MQTDFSAVPHGTLPAGTVTEHGTIEGSTLTAYIMTSGCWIPFQVVHGRRPPSERLVRLLGEALPVRRKPEPPAACSAV